ncbi:MAG: hypothetical protein QOJ78_2464 [Pseudonocardiales bacterium]|nr:hypothetical protein [Pseudonocardiales bacterium]MDT4928263.1 hypothetical protein [Pseudonocardiales bacterium]
MTRPRLLNPATAGAVFALIRDGAATTRTQIADKTGLSRTAVAARLATLVHAGLVAEADDGSTGVGRPPTRLSFNAAAGVVLAAAVGRSRTQVAVCDLAGEIIASRDVEQEIGLGPEELMPRVARELTSALSRARHTKDSVRGIGLSIPGTVNPRTLTSNASPIMSGWDGVGLDRYFGSFAHAPVFLENDTNVIALAERGAHLAAHDDALIVKASTGFGAGIVAGGVLQHGAVGAAGEIGHVKYSASRGRLCRCGETGCLEAVAGGWALVRNMRERGHNVEHIRDVASLAVAGDTDARDEIRASARHFGRVLAAAVTLLNPAIIVVGGDMTPAYDVFVAGLRETLYRDASTIATRDLTIVAATHGTLSGVRGCATLALDHVLSVQAVDAAVR